jgi:hypothetical protein
MINTSEIIAESHERNRVAGFHEIRTPITSLLPLFSYIRCQYMLSIIVACFIGSLLATAAHSQEPPSDATTSIAGRFPSGWEILEKEDSQTAPNLVISMAEPADLEASDSLSTSRAQPNLHIEMEPRAGSTANLRFFRLPDAIAAKPSSLTDRILSSPASFLALMPSEQPSWESSLVDSGSSTDVNSLLVYPLLRVNYADWQLPITLFSPSLRDSDVR